MTTTKNPSYSDHLATAIAALEACKTETGRGDREHAFDLRIHEENVAFWTRKVGA